MAAYTTIDNPELYFQCKLYTGNGSDNNAITFDQTDTSMQPDVVWIKSRSNSGYNHCLIDSVRGVTKVIRPNLTSDEDTYSDALKSFDSNGFTLDDDGSNGEMNTNTHTYVAWCWIAGTAWSNDASATGVGSLDSSGSKSATAGFSIISFTGTESGTPSIAHGLSSTPEFIISKARAITDNWMVFHGSFSAQEYISLNTTGAKASASSVWNSLPSSTVINMGDNAGVNDDGAMIMYAFHSVQGFSKFGKYTGNGNADGPYIHLGFRPAMIIVKSATETRNWRLWDTKRSTYNLTDKVIYPDLSNAEATGDSEIDILSNGFKFRKNSDNTSGETYIYMAFAESPFVNSNGVPTNAR